MSTDALAVQQSRLRGRRPGNGLAVEIESEQVMNPPRITVLEPAFVTGYRDDLFIGVWRGTVTLAGVNEWARQFEHMLARNPKGFVAISIVEATAPLPDAAVRKAVASTMDRTAGVLAMAGVHEATGFTGAAIRSVLLSLSNMTSGPYPRRIFGAQAEMAKWLAPYLDQSSFPLNAKQIAALVEEFRAMYDPTRGRWNGEARAVG